MSVDELRDQFRQEGIAWFTCRCGRKIYEHGQRTIPNTGGKEHVCARTQSGRFEPRTLPVLDYSNERGLHKP